MADLEKLKKNGTILRSSVTKLINNIETILKNDIVDNNSLEETVNQLKVKSCNLDEINKKIEPLLNLDEYENEINTVYDYADKISLTNFRAEKKLKENKNIIPLNQRFPKCAPRSPWDSA